MAQIQAIFIYNLLERAGIVILLPWFKRLFWTFEKSSNNKKRKIPVPPEEYFWSHQEGWKRVKPRQSPKFFHVVEVHVPFELDMGFTRTSLFDDVFSFTQRIVFFITTTSSLAVRWISWTSAATELRLPRQPPDDRKTGWLGWPGVLTFQLLYSLRFSRSVTLTQLAR